MRIAVLIFALLLCACRDQRPPGPNAEQNQQLNEAEQMLNEMSKNEVR